MVGLAFAVALATAVNDRIHICLLEAGTLPAGEPDPLDSRASALNLYSKGQLERWGAWSALAAVAAPIRHVHVSNQRRFGSTLLDAADVRDDVLGYVAENHHIGRALLARAQALGVDFRSGEPIVSLFSSPAGPGLSVGSGESLTADLVLLADGSTSALRDALGIAVDTRDTGQQALVANVEFAGQQQGVAYERFTPDGPLALLPLSDTVRGRQRFNLVWSMAADAAAVVSDLDDHGFLERLQYAFGWRLGRALAVGRRTRWPLVRHRACEQSRPGYLVVGNAAHALHPVAGQGFNLSLRDAAAFARVASAGIDNGIALGSRRLLRAYEQTVRDDQDLVIGATDTLSTLFARHHPLLDLPRDAALSLLDLSPTLRREVAALGAGAPAGA